MWPKLQQREVVFHRRRWQVVIGKLQKWIWFVFFGLLLLFHLHVIFFFFQQGNQSFLSNYTRESVNDKYCIQTAERGFKKPWFVQMSGSLSVTLLNVQRKPQWVAYLVVFNVICLAQTSALLIFFPPFFPSFCSSSKFTLDTASTPGCNPKKWSFEWD